MRPGAKQTLLVGNGGSRILQGGQVPKARGSRRRREGFFPFHWERVAFAAIKKNNNLVP